jgi:hypothetical protein
VKEGGDLVQAAAISYLFIKFWNPIYLCHLTLVLVTWNFQFILFHVIVAAMMSKFLAGGKLNPISSMCCVFIDK